MRRLFALLVLAVASACQPTPSSAPQSTPSPGPTAPTAAPSAAPLTTPSPPPTPQASTTPGYRFVYTPPPVPNAAPGAPQIFEVDISDQTIHQNSDVALRVLTTPSVASVVAAAMGREVAIPQVGAGLFAAQSHIPGVPFFFLNRTYDIEIRAATPNGQVSSVRLPIRLVR
jgi:hypothetical protein